MVLIMVRSTLVLLLATLCLWITNGEKMDVSYDGRAIKINGERQLLISGSVHYPRSPPEMWPKILAEAKASGLNTIETYVFWNYHEEVRGVFDFETENRDVLRFLRECQKAGLYVVLRIGPYVCAEWNYGGFPMWLRDLPGVEFRTNNDVFEEESARWFKKVVAMMTENNMWAPQGGPVILGQVENEYGNVDFSKKPSDAKAYALWAANLALSTYDEVPWIMCKEDDAPKLQGIIATCNGYYCDNWIEGHIKNRPGEPPMWTENWPGWYHGWGQPQPHRPTVDVAFSVARFYAKGGTFQNYYMFYGGTNFGRTAGGPLVVTSYDYDVALDEYGMRAQPKYDHLQQLHTVLNRNAQVMLEAMPTRVSLSMIPGVEAHVYGDCDKGPGLAFLSNYGIVSRTVTFREKEYKLQAWSVQILENKCSDMVYDSHVVSTPPLNREMLPTPFPAPSTPSDATWQLYSETPGLHASSVNPPQPQAQLMEQMSLTHDLTDYLWLTSVVEWTMTAGPQTLKVSNPNDVVHAFVNGKFVGTSGLNGSGKFPVVMVKGENKIDLLCMTVGLLSFNIKGFRLDVIKRGVRDGVTIGGYDLAKLAPVEHKAKPWLYQVGVEGEDLKLWTAAGQSKVNWTPLSTSAAAAAAAAAVPTPARSMLAGNASSSSMVDMAAGGLGAAAPYPITWWKRKFGPVTAHPAGKGAGESPVGIELNGMDKGSVWVNGHNLGRYWTMKATGLVPHNECSSEEYKGPYTPVRCVTGQGELSQTYYHIPREWLNTNSDNEVVVYEEVGGIPSKVGLFLRV